MKNRSIKSTLSLFALAIFFLTFSNCDKLLDDITLTHTFNTSFHIDVSEDDELMYYEEKVIDMTSNQEFVDNKDKIDKFTVREVYYHIIDYNGEPGIIGSGVATFKDGGATIGDPILQNNVDFWALYSSGDKTVLPVTENTKNQLADVLMDKMKFSIVLEGIMSDKPILIDVEMSAVIAANVKP